jgi:hypothetical protein
MYRLTPASCAAGTAADDVEDATSWRRSVPPPMTLTTASDPLIAAQISLFFRASAIRISTGAGSG